MGEQQQKGVHTYSEHYDLLHAFHIRIEIIPNPISPSLFLKSFKIVIFNKNLSDWTTGKLGCLRMDFVATIPIDCEKNIHKPEN